MSRDRAIEFFEQYSVPYDENKSEHSRAGWIQICCPFCGDSAFHLGYNTEGNYFSCYRCGGGKQSYSVIHELLHCGYVDAKRMAMHYFHGAARSSPMPQAGITVSSVSKVELPTSGSILQNKEAYLYLRSRFKFMSAFEFKEMVRNYRITYTDSIYQDSKGSSAQANRIIFPNILSGEIVSYQGRDYTGMKKAKYLTAKKEAEKIFCKSFLWNMDNVITNTIMVTEGVMDCLTVGVNCVHTHGVEFTREQVLALYAFDRVYLAFDMDQPGRLACKRLAALLLHRCKVSIVNLSEHDINTCPVSEILELRGLVQ
ncbi:MAG: toprim domain-containing protein [Alphaproteobacteria bacterium]|nr:toprim domain-containing protein [Alphaproteobacteria bacterium]